MFPSTRRELRSRSTTPVKKSAPRWTSVFRIHSDFVGGVEATRVPSRLAQRMLPRHICPGCCCRGLGSCGSGCPTFGLRAWHRMKRTSLSSRLGKELQRDSLMRRCVPVRDGIAAICTCTLRTAMVPARARMGTKCLARCSLRSRQPQHAGWILLQLRITTRSRISTRCASCNPTSTACC